MPDRYIELEVDGVAMLAVRVNGTIAVGETFRLRVAATEVGSDPTPPFDRIGKPCTLTLNPPVGSPVVVHGLVASLETSTEPEGDSVVHHHVLELAPPTLPLEIGRDHRYFQELDAVSIAKDVLSRAGIDVARFEIARTPRTRPYTVQHGESDWAFLTRLLHEEGITWRFELADDKTEIVFMDDSTHAPEIDGGTIPFHRGSALDSDAEAVFEVRKTTALVHGQVALREYNPAKPTVALDAKVEDGEATLARYDYPGRYTTPDEGKALAKLELESLRARRRVIHGRATSLKPMHGKIFELEEHPYPSFNGKLFVFATSLDIEHRVDDSVLRFGIAWQAIPAAVPFRAPLRQAARIMAGPQTSFMAGPSGNELHVDDAGRVRAQPHWDRVGARDQNSTTWMRVGQFPLGGSMVLPRIGWPLLIDHHAGDGDSPCIVTHLYDGTNPTPYPLPDNKTRTAWKTATTPGDGTANEVRFEDKAGAEEIFMNASKDMKVTIGDTKSKKVGNNHTQDIGSNLDVKVGTNRMLGVKADQKVTVGATESLTVSGGRSTSVGGGDTVTIGAARTVTVTKGRTLDANGGRTMTVGANMMAISALSVSRAVLGSASVTVGGAWISAAAIGLDNATLGAGAETVGGVKLQLGAGGVSLNVRAALAETVGAAYVTAAGGNFGESAGGALNIKVGGALIVNAPSIEIEAESEIKIVVGGSSITITSSSIEVKSPAIPAPGATIAKGGGQIHHNP
jgi:type VI secretion system secreted protein VgrG